jgi:hypothetical protein
MCVIGSSAELGMRSTTRRKGVEGGAYNAICNGLFQRENKLKGDSYSHWTNSHSRYEDHSVPKRELPGKRVF